MRIGARLWLILTDAHTAIRPPVGDGTDAETQDGTDIGMLMMTPLLALALALVGEAGL